MSRTLADIDADIEVIRDRLSELGRERNAFLLSNAKFKVGEVVVFGRNKTEGKIIAIEARYSDAMPVVVLKKKNGEWGERQRRLYSWDLEGGR